MGAGVVFLVVVAMVLVTVAAVWWQQRALDKPGARSTSSALGDGFGNLIDVFDPGQARATRDLQHEQHKGPVTPTPDRDPDDPLTLILGPGGVPRSVRIRRSR
jgi:hypothetical protein